MIITINTSLCGKKVFAMFKVKYISKNLVKNVKNRMQLLTDILKFSKKFMALCLWWKLRWDNTYSCYACTWHASSAVQSLSVNLMSNYFFKLSLSFIHLHPLSSGGMLSMPYVDSASLTQKQIWWQSDSLIQKLLKRYVPHGTGVTSFSPSARMTTCKMVSTGQRLQQHTR